MTDLRDLSVAIIGPGAIGDWHAEAIAACGARILAVVGPTPEQNADFAARHQIPSTYTDINDLLGRQDVSCVIIASPSPVHADQTTAALYAGKPVLCEIPIGLSLAEAQAVAEVSARTGITTMVAHTQRFWASHRAVRDRVESGELQVRHVVARAMTHRQANVGWTGRARDWTDHVLWHHGAHLVDSALRFLDATQVDVLGTCGPIWPGSETPMDVGAVLVAPDGDLATLALSYHSRLTLSDYVIIAEDQTLEIRNGQLVNADEVNTDSRAASATESAVMMQDREFLTAVVEGRKPSFTADDALPTMRVLDTLERSARENSMIKEWKAHDIPMST